MTKYTVTLAATIDVFQELEIEADGYEEACRLAMQRVGHNADLWKPAAQYINADSLEVNED